MIPNDYPVFVYRGSGIEFEVYHDRIVVTGRHRLKQTTIPHELAHIVQVDITGAPARRHLRLDMARSSPIT